MAFFTVKTDKETIKDSSSGNYIIDSGMYDVKIKHLIVRKNDMGGLWLDMLVDYKSTPQMIYRAIPMINNDGSQNIGQNLFNKLCIILGGSDGTFINDPIYMDVETRKGTTEKVKVLTDFDNMDVTIRMQKQYYQYNGKRDRRTQLRNIFRTMDKATASEIINNTEKGKQYERELKYASQILFKDGITEADIQTIEKERMERTKGSSQPIDNKAPKSVFETMGSEVPF